MRFLAGRFFQFVAVVSFLSVVASANISHASTEELRVGIVDLQVALEKSSAGKKAQSQYEEAVKSAQTDLDKKKASFEKNKEQFEKQANSLSESARLEKQEALLEKEKDLRRAVEDTQQKLRRENTRLVSALVKELQKVVQDYGKREGYTVILEKSTQGVLYADNAIDVTQQVVTEFNKVKPSL